MNSKLYKFLVAIVFLGTIFIGVLYLWDQKGTRQPASILQPPTPTKLVLPTATPRPTSTPIVPPSRAENPGDINYFYGDWDTALSSYQMMLENPTTDDDQAAALLGLGKTYYQLGEYQKSLEHLRKLVSSYPSSSYLPQAYIALAETYHTLDRHLEEAEAYNGYLTLNPGVIDGYIQHKKGDALSRANQHTAAINAYQSALAAGGEQGNLQVQLKIGQEYAALEDHSTAVLVFQEVYAQSTNDYQKARADYLLGQSYLELGEPQKAQEAFLDAVTHYPLSYDAYLALVELVNNDFPVNDLDRGLVNYFAGQYSRAVEAFDRYLADPEAPDPGTAYYYKAFALRALERYDQALQTWDLIIQNLPDHDYYDNAWEFKAYTEWWYLGEYSGASQTLHDFVAQNPYHQRAAEFLFDAGRVEERGGHLEQAAAFWKRVYNEYPTSAYANKALFLSGMTDIRLGNNQSALEKFSLYQESSRSAENLSQALFWTGKTYQLLGNQEAALAAWQEAANTDPTGYYSERARDLLQNREPFSPPLDYDLGFDARAEKIEAQKWMRETFVIPTDTNLNGLGSLAMDPRMIRGTELWTLDKYDQAREEFESLREEYSYDPVISYRLAVYLQDLGLYRPAIFAARQVLNAAGMDDAQTLNAPDFFNHIRFGTYYSELVIPAGQDYDIHPLLLFSVIRQESL